MPVPGIGFLLGLLAPSPVSLADIRHTTHPNPYAKALPAQAAAAVVAAPQGRLKGGLSGLTGSEQDYAEEQIAGDPNLGGPLEALNDGLARRTPMPTSWYLPHLPAELVEGRGTGYVTGAYNKGWVRLLIDRGDRWGASTRSAAPNVQTATLLEPDEKTPLPTDMAAAYAATNKGATRLSDMFGD